VVAYMLTSWDDASIAPGAEYLPEIFERVYAVESLALSYSVFLKLGSDDQLQFIFYSLSDAGLPPLKCYAAHLAFEAIRNSGEEFANNILRDCMDGRE